MENTRVALGGPVVPVAIWTLAREQAHLDPFKGSVHDVAGMVLDKFLVQIVEKIPAHPILKRGERRQFEMVPCTMERDPNRPDQSFDLTSRLAVAVRARLMAE
ncbi:hypothetical protein WDW37_08980 [Bdellovibrionota bacterium FG-1]